MESDINEKTGQEFEAPTPGAAVTERDVEMFIADERSVKLGEKSTAVTLILKNGFEVTGLSGCVDPKAYNHEIGTKYARIKAIDQVWQLLGFKAQQERYEASLAGQN